VPNGDVGARSSAVKPSHVQADVEHPGVDARLTASPAAIVELIEQAAE
jgi:hypothetical protein